MEDRPSGAELALIAVMIACAVIIVIQTARGLSSSPGAEGALMMALLVLLLIRRR